MQASTLKFILIISIFFSVFISNDVFSMQAPDFKLEGQNKTIQLSRYKGKVVYVDFWASWCVPCRKSFDWMNKMQSKYGDEGLKIIAINLDESKSKAKKFLQQLPASFEIAFDPKGSTAETYNIKIIPSSFIINQRGKIVHVSIGFQGNDGEKLETKIRQLIHQTNISR